MEVPDGRGREQRRMTLEELEAQQLITVHDAAIVSWPEGAKKPKTKQANDMVAGARSAAASGDCSSASSSSSR